MTLCPFCKRRHPGERAPESRGAPWRVMVACIVIAAGGALFGLTLGLWLILTGGNL